MAFRSWITWLIKGRAALVGLRNEFSHVDGIAQGAAVSCNILKGRIDDLEKALVDQQKAHDADIADLREQLATRQRRQPSGRAFAVLQKVAELGAQQENKSA